MSSTTSTQTIGDAFINLFTFLPEDDNNFQAMVDFISSQSFLSAYGTSSIVNSLVSLISEYPLHKYITQSLVRNFYKSSILTRVSSLLTTISPEFFQDLSSDVQESVVQIFSTSPVLEVANIAKRFIKNTTSFPILFDVDDQIFSFSDIFTEFFYEKAKSRTSSEIQFKFSDLTEASKEIEKIQDVRMQTFSASDIANYIINLLCEPKIADLVESEWNNNFSSVLQLLKPFKPAKINIETLISACDQENFQITSTNHFQIFISALREVTLVRNIPASAFFKKWKNPLTQISILSKLISSPPKEVTFPKPIPLSHASPIIIDEFKSDFWRCIEFVNVLSDLYNSNPYEVDLMLEKQLAKKGSQNGQWEPAILLLVLAQGGKPSPFSAHLLHVLITSSSHYMSCVSSIWATSKEFLSGTLNIMYEKQPSLIGRCFDVIDDLNIFNEVIALSPFTFQIILHLFAFLRHGYDFTPFLQTHFKFSEKVDDQPEQPTSPVPKSDNGKRKGKGKNVNQNREPPQKNQNPKPSPKPEINIQFLNSVIQIFQNPNEFGILSLNKEIPLSLPNSSQSGTKVDEKQPISNNKDHPSESAKPTKNTTKDNKNVKETKTMKLNIIKEKKEEDKHEKKSADFIFFTFLDNVYAELPEIIQNKVKKVFIKCLSRTPSLKQHNFKWSPKDVSVETTIISDKDDDHFLDYAISPSDKDILKFANIFQELTKTIPKDEAQAEKNGTKIGKLIAMDRIDMDSTSKALQLIFDSLNSSDKSAFSLAKSALKELSNSFDLIIPFARQIAANEKVKQVLPDIYASAVEVCNPAQDLAYDDNFGITIEEEHKNQIILGYNDLGNEEFGEVTFPLHPALQRFYTTRRPLNISYQIDLDSPNFNPDECSLFYVNNEINRVYDILISTKSSKNRSEEKLRAFDEYLIQAAIFKVHEYITGPERSCVSTITALSKLGNFLNKKTIANAVPVPSRFLPIPRLITYAYSHDCLKGACSFLVSLFSPQSELRKIFNPPNPWAVSILTVLSAIFRLPYLRSSIRHSIHLIFSSFSATPSIIEPYPLERLKIKPITNSDFFFPPVDFTTTLSHYSAEKLYSGDVNTIFYVVNQHVKLSPSLEQYRSVVVREIVRFIFSKVPAIAESAAMTSFTLVLKDFARSTDSAAVTRFVRALLSQTISGISMMTISLLINPYEGSSTKNLRKAFNANAAWLDSLVRQLAFHRAEKLVKAQLEPIQRIKKTAHELASSNNPMKAKVQQSLSNSPQEENNEVQNTDYWDVKSFPPSIAKRMPHELWPQEFGPPQSSDIKGKRFFASSLMPTGLLECYNVPLNLRKTYTKFTAAPLSIYTQDVDSSELPINKKFVDYILSCFIQNPQTGNIIDFKVEKSAPQFNYQMMIPILCSLIYCFPPTIDSVAAKKGSELLNQLFHGIPIEKKKECYPQVTQILYSSIPHLWLVNEMVRCDMIELSNLESIIMNFIETPKGFFVDVSPLLNILEYLLIIMKSMAAFQCQRLLNYVCTYPFGTNDLINKIRFLYFSEPDKKVNRQVVNVQGQTERFVQLFNHYQKNHGFLPDIFNNIVYHKEVGEFWEEMILSSFYPDNRYFLIEVLCAFCKSQSGKPEILASFSNKLFNLASKAQISYSYFGSIYLLTVQRLNFSEYLKTFGGVMNDIIPSKYYNLTGIWLYLLPPIVSALVKNQSFFSPTAKLISTFFTELRRFPQNWKEYPSFCKMYKTILRLVLLLIHDVPQLIHTHLYDFITSIPLQFRRLRNIILSIPMPAENMLRQPKKLNNLIYEQNIYPYSFYSSNPSNSMLKSELILPIIEQVQTDAYFGSLSYLAETDKRLNFSEEYIMGLRYWNSINQQLLKMVSFQKAQIIIEILADQIRSDNDRTKFFEYMIYTLFKKSDLSWDGIHLQDVIFHVVMARSENIFPVPEGILHLKTLLERDPGFEFIKSTTIYHDPQ